MTDLKPLTEQQLTDIETRANAATPGPWCTDSWEIYQGGEDDIPALMKWIGETCRADDSDGSRNDAAFIAHARTDVPALLAEIRRLKGQRQYLIAQLAKRDAESGRGDEALREFLAEEQPAADAQPTDPREPFRFVDDDGDYLHIGIPATPANGGPAISFHTETEPVHLPVDRVDEVIATLRRLKAAQQ